MRSLPARRTAAIALCVTLAQVDDEPTSVTDLLHAVLTDDGGPLSPGHAKELRDAVEAALTRLTSAVAGSSAQPGSAAALLVSVAWPARVPLPGRSASSAPFAFTQRVGDSRAAVLTSAVPAGPDQTVHSLL